VGSVYEYVVNVRVNVQAELVGVVPIYNVGHLVISILDFPTAGVCRL